MLLQFIIVVVAHSEFVVFCCLSFCCVCFDLF